MAARKITRRWIMNSFGVIVCIILVLEITAALAVQRYYYSQAQQALTSRADIILNSFMQYANDPSNNDIETQIRTYVTEFDQRESMELMIIDSARSITATSSGFLPQDQRLPDLDDALLDPSRPGEHIGKLGTNEKVFAVSVLTNLPGQPFDQNQTLAIRLVTSLTQVDRQIAVIVFSMILLGIMVLALVLFSSSYFLGSIIRPIGEVGETARKIAQGDFQTRLVKKNDDEIGELCDIINYMADELQTAENLKNDFISSVSHELRTPLTAIQGWGETIRVDGGEDKELLDKGMGVIIGETTRLSDMVEELLDFSRMQSGRLRLIRSRIDAIAELSEAVLMYTQRAERDGIKLLFEEDSEVAPVYADKNRLRQVFINIIDNAIKYSDRGGTVEVFVTVTPKTLTIVVQDTGIGISEKDLPQIKSRFYKANFTRRGSGIGLAVADELVTRHDGTLAIASKEGEGTRITITLPIYQKIDDIAQIDAIDESEQPEKEEEI